MEHDRASDEFVLDVFSDILEEEAGKLLMELFNEMGTAALTDAALEKLANLLRDEHARRCSASDARSAGR